MHLCPYNGSCGNLAILEKMYRDYLVYFYFTIRSCVNAYDHIFNG